MLNHGHPKEIGKQNVSFQQLCLKTNHWNINKFIFSHRFAQQSTKHSAQEPVDPNLLPVSEQRALPIVGAEIFDWIIKCLAQVIFSFNVGLFFLFD